MSEPSKSSDWEKLLAHAALLQAKVPSAVLVGGTAAALHAGHRISFDHDHVLRDLGRHFDEEGILRVAYAYEQANKIK